MKKINILFVAILGLVFTLTVQADTTSGLVAHYKLDGNANNSIGNNYQGELYGATATSDRNDTENSALLFSGNSSDYLLIPATTIYNLSTGSISFRFKANNLTSDDRYLIFMRTGTRNGETAQLSVQFSIGNGNVLLYGVDSVNSEKQMGTTIIEENTWYHIVLEWDETTWKAYVNG